jgi:hypothetical protein
MALLVCAELGERGSQLAGALAPTAVSSGTDVAYANPSDPPHSLLPDPATTVVPMPPLPKGFARSGVMDEEFLFWDNLTFYQQIGLA